MESKKLGIRKVLYLLLAFLVAVVLWYYVDETGNNGAPRMTERVITGVPIIYTGEDTVLADRGLMLLDEGTDATVDLTVEGGRRLVSWLVPSRIRVIADLSDITSAGEKQVNFTVNYTGRFSNGISTKERPSNVTVSISELYKKTVEVRCELVGNVAEGYNAGQLQLSHTSVDIWGQEEVVSPVSYAKVTLDIGNAESSVSQNLTVQYYDKNNQLLEKDGIRTTVEQVQATLPVSVTKELRLAMNFIAAAGVRVGNVDFSIEPKTITVSGPAEVLRDRETIVLGDFDLMSIIGRSSPSWHTYSITIPSGCTNLSGVTRATLEISFKDMAQARVSTEQIRFENAPEGKTVERLTEETAVSIFGTTADVESVTGEDITLVADLSDYNAALGSYTIPAKVEIHTDGDVGISGEYQVRVMIREEIPGEDEPEEEETGGVTPMETEG